jgi:hypothetical protein
LSSAQRDDVVDDTASQRMNADVRTWQYLVQIALFSLSVILIGIAGGCMIGIFVYRRGLSSKQSAE